MDDLQTPRLNLRPIKRSDLDAFHQLVIDPEVRRFLCDDQILSREQVIDWIEISHTLFRSNHFGLWAVFPRHEKELIGFCGFWYFHTPPELELVFGVAPDYWNQGFATEAAEAVMKYGFDRLQFDRIASSADAPNLASVRVMQKLGMSWVRRSTVNGSELVHYSIAQEKSH